MATISGTISAVDSSHQAIILDRWSRSGSILFSDSLHVADLEGIVINDTTTVMGDSTFVQDYLLQSDGLTLTLIDSTFINGVLIDGTYVDSTYTIRWFDPIWLNYSIWKMDGSSEEIIGTRERHPLNPRVGIYYANMFAPSDPGQYQIRWRYQKDTELYASEVREPFRVETAGIDADQT